MQRLALLTNRQAGGLFVYPLPGAWCCIHDILHFRQVYAKQDLGLYYALVFVPAAADDQG